MKQTKNSKPQFLSRTILRNRILSRLGVSLASVDDIDIVLHDGVSRSGVKRDRPRYSVSLCKTEIPGAPYDSHLPSLLEDTVPAQYSQRTAIVNPVGEVVVQGHQQPDLVKIRECVEALSPADDFG